MAMRPSAADGASKAPRSSAEDEGIAFSFFSQRADCGAHEAVFSRLLLGGRRVPSEIDRGRRGGGEYVTDLSITMPGQLAKEHM